MSLFTRFKREARGGRPTLLGKDVASQAEMLIDMGVEHDELHGLLAELEPDALLNLAARLQMKAEEPGDKRTPRAISNMAADVWDYARRHGVVEKPADLPGEEPTAMVGFADDPMPDRVPVQEVSMGPGDEEATVEFRKEQQFDPRQHASYLVERAVAGDRQAVADYIGGYSPDDTNLASVVASMGTPELKKVVSALFQARGLEAHAAALSKVYTMRPDRTPSAPVAEVPAEEGAGVFEIPFATEAGSHVDDLMLGGTIPPKGMEHLAKTQEYWTAIAGKLALSRYPKNSYRVALAAAQTRGPFRAPSRRAVEDMNALLQEEVKRRKRAARRFS